MVCFVKTPTADAVLPQTTIYISTSLREKVLSKFSFSFDPINEQFNFPSLIQDGIFPVFNSNNLACCYKERPSNSPSS